MTILVIIGPMFTKPTKRVRVTAMNVHDGKSRTFTLYGCDAEEVIHILESAVQSEPSKGRRSLARAGTGGK